MTIFSCRTFLSYANLFIWFLCVIVRIIAFLLSCRSICFASRGGWGGGFIGLLLLFRFISVFLRFRGLIRRWSIFRTFFRRFSFFRFSWIFRDLHTIFTSALFWSGRLWASLPVDDSFMLFVCLATWIGWLFWVCVWSSWPFRGWWDSCGRQGDYLQLFCGHLRRYRIRDWTSCWHDSVRMAISVVSAELVVV